jgi:hypothetical protein
VIFLSGARQALLCREPTPDAPELSVGDEQREELMQVMLVGTA